MRSREGAAKGSNVVELRRYERTPVDVTVEFSLRSSAQRFSGRAKDLSVGGMFVETAFPAAFATEIVVHVTLPGQRTALAIPGVVRWTGSGGMGIQFGLLGARETHAITQLASKR
ncbi:MAG: PilZ domain-containing protein [Polyangiaceae bacterium]